ncbi:MAG: transposase, partial [Acidithiobacillus ferrivorans]
MKHYSVERKAAVLRKMLPPLNLSVAELAQQQEGISDGTLYHWRKQAMAGGDRSAVSKRKAEGWS